MQQQYSTDILIIGAGPVGLFAAFQAGMMNMKCCIVDVLDEVGGQCTALYPEKPIYDIPAYPQISAQDLINNLQQQADSFKPNYILGQQVISLSRNQDNSFTTITNNGTQIHCKAIIIAAGCGAFGPNRPPLPEIEQYEDKSIFYYIKDRSKFTDKNIVIAGGGDSAVDWALSLAPIAKKVTLVHRRAKFRCAPNSASLLAKAEQNGNIELAVPYQLHSCSGQDGILESVTVSDLDNNLKTLDADYLLPFFGLSMELGPIRDWNLNLHQNHIEVSLENYQTNIVGVYAIGDIAHYPGKLKLILTGFAESASAIHHAYSIVNDGKIPHFQHSTDMTMPTK